MSEQDSMTREQLEAAGYTIHEFVYSVIVELGENNCFVAPVNNNKQVAINACLQAAAAHYRQQQELARLREAIRAIANALCGCGGDVITDILPDMFMSDVWACGSAPVCMEIAEIVVSVWPTVSKTERAE